jgi:hypothetical protein
VSYNKSNSNMTGRASAAGLAGATGSADAGAPKALNQVNSAELEETIAYLAKRHRVSQAIVREIARTLGSGERGAIEREIARGKARR